MKNKKVLILYAPFGAGHKTAAKAIEEAFKEKYPDVEAKNVDVLDFGFKIFRYSAPFIFDYINAKIPFLYKWIYNFYNHSSRYKFLNHASNLLIKKEEFISFIKKFSPDFILSTNPLPMQLVSKTKQKDITDILSANVCTDFGFHSFWHNLDVNYYFVANEEIKKTLISHNVAPESIKVTGIPIGLKFGKKADREKVLRDLNFSASRPVLLIVGVKITYKNLLKVIKGVKEKNNFVQFIVVAGRDKNLQKKLEKSEINNDPQIKVFGFVNNLDEYMGSADLVFTKPGGLTASECLANGLPMIINDIMPGQEQDNVNYLVSHGSGIEAESIEEVIENIINLFNQSDKLKIMEENCLKIAKPNAAAELADFVNNLF
jgi:processive 1,2-diacylglycerol beta-glucosyltransferase